MGSCSDVRAVRFQQFLVQYGQDGESKNPVLDASGYLTLQKKSRNPFVIGLNWVNRIKSNQSKVTDAILHNLKLYGHTLGPEHAPGVGACRRFHKVNTPQLRKLWELDPLEDAIRVHVPFLRVMQIVVHQVHDKALLATLSRVSASTRRDVLVKCLVERANQGDIASLHKLATYLTEHSFADDYFAVFAHLNKAKTEQLLLHMCTHEDTKRAISVSHGNFIPFLSFVNRDCAWEEHSDIVYFLIERAKNCLKVEIDRELYLALLPLNKRLSEMAVQFILSKQSKALADVSVLDGLKSPSITYQWEPGCRVDIAPELGFLKEKNHCKKLNLLNPPEELLHTLARLRFETCLVDGVVIPAGCDNPEKLAIVLTAPLSKPLSNQTLALLRRFFISVKSSHWFIGQACHKITTLLSQNTPILKLPKDIICRILREANVSNATFRTLCSHARTLISVQSHAQDRHPHVYSLAQLVLHEVQIGKLEAAKELFLQHVGDPQFLKSLFQHPEKLSFLLHLFLHSGKAVFSLDLTDQHGFYGQRISEATVANVLAACPNLQTLAIDATYFSHPDIRLHSSQINSLTIKCFQEMHCDLSQHYKLQHITLVAPHESRLQPIITLKVPSTQHTIEIISQAQVRLHVNLEGEAQDAELREALQRYPNLERLNGQEVESLKSALEERSKNDGT